MVQLLVHTHINEAKLAHSYLPTDSAVLYFHLLQDSLYRYFRVDSARFHKALKQYSDHPDYFDKLYTRVVDSLAWREQRRYIRYK